MFGGGGVAAIGDTHALARPNQRLGDFAATRPHVLCAGGSGRCARLRRTDGRYRRKVSSQGQQSHRRDTRDRRARPLVPEFLQLTIASIGSQLMEAPMVKLLFDFGDAVIADEQATHIGRRLSTRLRRMLRPAKLLVDGHEFLCVLRDISNGGLQLQLFHDLPKYDQMAVEFDNGRRFQIRKVWKSAGRMGCAFLQHVDIHPILSTEDLAHPQRQPRLHVEHDAYLYAGDTKAPVIVRDISQRGVSLDCPD